MIYQVTAKQDWLEALKKDVYEPASLKTEGFIHKSFIKRLFTNKVALISDSHLKIFI